LGAISESDDHSFVKKKKDQWQSCNVLREGEAERRLWQFRPRGTSCAQVRELTATGNEPLPAKVVRKDFQSLLQPKLNIAWLPPGEVFLCVIELPTTDAAELQGMIELQLEKLSPLPATQTCWTYVALPRKPGAAASRVLLVVASRHAVEAFLGRLELAGFLADRLELPQIDELLTCLNQGDGVWVLPRRVKDRFFALIAWLADGEVQHVGLTFLPETGWQEVIQGQLAQVVWSGELAGWLHGAPVVHLVAEGDLVTEFEPVLREFAGSPVDVRPPQSKPQLALLTAARARENQPVSLLPAEYIARYRQVFVDRIWMRSLGALVMVYLLGVLAYFAAIEWARHGQASAELTQRSLAKSYTNTLQLAQQVKILQNQMNLKYAALDSFKAVAEKLPDGLTINSFSFQRGSKVQLFGSAAPGNPGQITAFVGELQGVESNGRRLFSAVESPTIQADPASGQNRWNFECDLANPEQAK
jgi:hypothetical protein